MLRRAFHETYGTTAAVQKDSLPFLSLLFQSLLQSLKEPVACMIYRTSNPSHFTEQVALLTTYTQTTYNI